MVKFVILALALGLAGCGVDASVRTPVGGIGAGVNIGSPPPAPPAAPPVVVVPR
jgi:hypothetical protein